MKVVINTCFGGFGLSEAAYLKLIEYGVPVRRYVEQKLNPETNRYDPEPANDGEVIFDRELDTRNEDAMNDLYWKFKGKSSMARRYWDSWIGVSRAHPLVVRVVEELGEAANGPHAELRVVEIPDGVEWEIDDYDGSEHVAEKHRTWR